MKCKKHNIDLRECYADGTNEPCMVCDKCIEEFNLRRIKLRNIKSNKMSNEE